MNLALIGGTLVTPFRTIKNGALVIHDGKIFEIGKSADLDFPDNCEMIDVSGRFVCPGFVDLLVHGGGGAGFADGNDNSIKAVSDYFLSHGSTTLLASLFAKPEDNLLDDLRRVADYIDNHPGTNIRGIHMEGPYLNRELKGAMNENYFWQPSVESWDKMWDASRGKIKLMTIAPELPGAIDVMRKAAQNGVVLSIGHSTATYEEVELAIDNGAAHVTHIFNAMVPFHHREPGVILGSFLHNELKIELIADNMHVHPAVMEFLLKVKGANGIILVSDSVPVNGVPEGEYEFADQAVFMKNKKAFLKDGTLAGSTLTLNTAVKNIVNTTNTRITDAVRMATVNGAKVINLEDRKGILAAGKDADIVVLDENYNVEMTILGGEVAYQRTLQ